MYRLRKLVYLKYSSHLSVRPDACLYACQYKCGLDPRSQHGTVFHSAVHQ